MICICTFINQILLKFGMIITELHSWVQVKWQWPSFRVTAARENEYMKQNWRVGLYKRHIKTDLLFIDIVIDTTGVSDLMPVLIFFI